MPNWQNFKSPYIFGHRGGMGLCIENTMKCFKNAINLGVGIESDVQLTKDNILICFHDFSINHDSKSHDIANLSYKDLLKLEFSDHRKIPTILDLFSIVLKNPELRLSFDVRNFQAAKKLVDLARNYDLLNRVEITDRRLSLISRLRSYERHVNLVYTLPENVIKVDDNNVNFPRLKRLEVKAINVRSHRANIHNFRNIIENDLDCYVWALNYKSRTKRIFGLQEKNKKVAAIYTDYPDMALQIRDELN
jgi:glycerophosphoryl diester phosphodiesterase